jgi:HAMP domain-containing protein
VSRWVPGDLAVPPTGDTAHTITRLDPDHRTPDDGTYWPWTLCGNKVTDQWTQSEGQHRPCAVCANADATDEIPRIPVVDRQALENAVYVIAATAAFLNTVADTAGELAAATQEFRDELQAFLDDPRTP